MLRGQIAAGQIAAGQFAAQRHRLGVERQHPVG